MEEKKCLNLKKRKRLLGKEAVVLVSLATIGARTNILFIGCSSACTLLIGQPAEHPISPFLFGVRNGSDKYNAIQTTRAFPCSLQKRQRMNYLTRPSRQDRDTRETAKGERG